METMGIITAAERAASGAFRPAGSDYTGPDGMIYCGLCGTRKTCRVDILGRERVVSCVCECQNAAYEAAQKAEKAEAAKRRRVAVSFPTSAYELMTFANDDGEHSEASEVVREFCESFDRANPMGLLLWGGCGSGKTYLAACAANKLMDAGYTVCFTSVARIATAMETDRGALERALNCNLLVVDDLGSERETSYMDERAFALIDGRYKQRRPMIVSTNIGLGEMQNPGSLAKQRVFGRILETCFPVNVEGDRRLAGWKNS